MKKHMQGMFTIAFLVLVNKIFITEAVPQGGDQRQYGITNFEINEGVKRLEKEIRALENKLSRHEFREAQVADFSTKTLNTLNSDHALNQKNMKAVAKQLANLEEKLMALDALVKTTDERQRDMLSKLGEGLNRLLMVRPDFQGPPLPPLLPQISGEVDKDVKKILKKVNFIEDIVKRDVKTVNNEVKIVGESLKKHMEQLTTRHDRLWNDWTTCQNDHVRALTEATSSLSQTGNVFVEQISEAKQLLKTSESSKDNCKELSSEIADKLNILDKIYQDQEKDLAELNKDTHSSLEAQTENLATLIKESRIEKSYLEKSFGSVVDNLQELRNHSDDQLGQLQSKIRTLAEESTHKISKVVDSLAAAVKDKTANILNALDDSASMSENLQNSLTDNFEDLTKDIRSLKKVEQVMLNTADAVLDTKRSMEFGIQQVIIELSAAVKNSGKTINSTLSDQIRSISFAILKNQTTALTNMTTKLENEISQVWRQIGIMYEQLTQSVSILDDLQSTTAQQMNASLDKVGTMDGTVGAINNKVADVEDNLNHLLGRLSLVTSEFSHMKSGVGAELEKLRQMAQDFSNRDIVEYNINRKRSVSLSDVEDPYV